MTFKEYINYMNDRAIDFNKGVAITVTLPILAAIMLTLAIVYESAASFMAAVFFATLIVRFLIDIWGSYKRYRQIDEPTWALLRLIRSKPECMERMGNESVWECGGIAIKWSWETQRLDNSTYDLFNPKERELLSRPFKLHEKKEREFQKRLERFEYALKRDLLAKQVEEQQ